MNHVFLEQLLIYLVAAVVAVPIFKRIGLGAVLGYLAAGAVIGPWGLRLIYDYESILHFSEFGVVLLLFLIGLELLPSRLWSLRRSVFGTGSIQMGTSAILIFGFAMMMGFPLMSAGIAAFGLALSSTAFALQVLAEKGQLAAQHGRSAFTILLFQDLAVIPVLAIIPIIASESEMSHSGPETMIAIGKVVGAIAIVVILGKTLLNRIFRILASTRVSEVFTAAALLLVIGLALLMDSLGLSMALGAFIGGVLLADSEFRHELEADIEPFKGLLLGLFFIAVGMSVDFGLLVDQTGSVAAWVIALVALKFIMLFVIGRVTKHNNESSLKLAAVLSQGGEFGFVLFSVAVQSRAMSQEQSNLLILVVTISMILTPFIVGFIDKKTAKSSTKKKDEKFDAIDEQNKIIVAGFGRFGQIVSRILRSRKISFTALESNPEHVDFVRRFGSKIYYGDASRIDLLRAAGADSAEIFVLAIDEPEGSIRTAEIVRHHFPHLKIFARARNRSHALKLMQLGIDNVVRETLYSSLKVADQVLTQLGFEYGTVKDTVKKFHDHDERTLLGQLKYMGNEQEFIEFSKKSAQELERLFEEDEKSAN